MNCVSHAQLVGFHVVAIVFLLYLGDLFVCLLLYLLNSSKTRHQWKSYALKQGGPELGQVCHFNRLGHKIIWTWTNDTRMYTPCVLCHLIRWFFYCFFFLFFFLWWNVTFRLKWPFLLWNFFLTCTIESLKRSIIQTEVATRKYKEVSVVIILFMCF